jgi:hypothetical protein
MQTEEWWDDGEAVASYPENLTKIINKSTLNNFQCR